MQHQVPLTYPRASLFNTITDPAMTCPVLCEPAGSLQVNDDLTLSTRDAAEVTGASDSSTQLNLKAGGEGAHFLLIEMKKE